MSQILKLRRSAVDGKRPTNSQLELGELSINTTDGKIYFAKSGSLSASIEEVVSTNAQNTGSLNLSGSFNLIGTENITGSLNTTGSLRVLGNTSLTSLVVSGSDSVANVQAFVPDSTIYNAASFNTPDRVASGVRFNWNNENWTIGAARGVTTDIDGLVFSRNGVRKYMIDEDGKASLSGSMDITGSLTVSGSMTLGSDVGSYLMFKGVISSSLVPDSDGDTHYLGGNDKRWAGVYGKTGSFTRLSNFNTPSSSLFIERANITGSFTGSYIGDGNGLYNIPASGVTGLQLDKIASGAVTASVTDNGFQINSGTSITGSLRVSSDVIVTGSLQVNSDVIVNGSVTAREFHTLYETQSIIYSSGSTRFGDTQDDTHTFTGSVNITGSLYVNGEVVGTGKLNSTEFYNFTSSTTSIIASSSYAQTASYVLNPIVVSGVTRTSIVTSPTATWSFNHQMGQKYPSIQVFNSDGYIVMPSEIKAVDENNLNVYFSQPQTGVVSVTLGGAGTAGTSGTSGVAGTSGTSGTSGRDGLGGYSNTYSASTTWSVVHNLGMDFPIVTAWDTNRKVVLPTEIYSVDNNNIEVYFSQPIAGTISVIKIL